jgi:hypothetical protein
MVLFVLEQPHNADAVIVYNNITNSDIDTDKPIVPQFNSILQYYKAHVSAVQYKNYAQRLGQTIENATNACSNPFATIFPQAQKACSFYVPFVYVLCQADIIKQSVFECSNPSLSDYIVSHAMRNPEANVRYAFENQKRTTGNASDIFSHSKSIILR